MKYQPVNLAQALDLVDALWRPRVNADEMRGLVRIQGNFVWLDQWI